MKRTLSITLITYLVALMIPVGAQERFAVSPGPIARSITHQAFLQAAIQPSNASADAGWERVRKLSSEAEILITVRGSQPVQRQFITANESEVVVRDSGRNVTRIPRGGIAEIRSRRAPRHPVALGALIGTGGALAVYLGLYDTDTCGSPQGCDAYKGGLAALFTGVGAAVGAGVGAIVGASRKGRVDVIYRAP